VTPLQLPISRRRFLLSAGLGLLLALCVATLAISSGDRNEHDRDEEVFWFGEKHDDKRFGISGDVSAPITIGGDGEPVDVVITNPNTRALVVSDLRASVLKTDRPRACGVSNFRVEQSTARIVVARRSKLALTGAARPRVVWINHPNVVQNGCLGAELTLLYTGKSALR
jgi:hypothetical protein